jgi:hypothetical protein
MNEDSMNDLDRKYLADLLPIEPRAREQQCDTCKQLIPQDGGDTHLAWCSEVRDLRERVARLERATDQVIDVLESRLDKVDSDGSTIGYTKSGQRVAGLRKRSDGPLIGAHIVQRGHSLGGLVTEAGKRIDLLRGVEAKMTDDGNVTVAPTCAAGEWIAVSSGERPPFMQPVLACGPGWVEVLFWRRDEWWGTPNGAVADDQPTHFAQLRSPEAT